MIGSLNTFLCALISVGPHGTSSVPRHLVVLYVGPDQILPLTSLFGAIVGILLIFWNKVVSLFHRLKKLMSRN